MDKNIGAKTEIVTERNTSFVMKTGSIFGTMKISFFFLAWLQLSSVKIESYKFPYR